MAGALIVTAEVAARDRSRFDSLRRRHYPADRNRVPAHLTIFHALPPSAEDEVRSRLAAHARWPPLKAMVAGLMDLGGGVAFRIVSDELEALRKGLAADLHGLLGAQDAAGWRPHVTIQNKVPPKVARALKADLERDFRPRSIIIVGLGLQRYLGGEWETLATYRFRGS